MMRQGLNRQLERFKGDRDIEKVLKRALKVMERSEKRVGKLKSSELWTWAARNGKIVAEPFGQSAKHTDEANALQLWSNTR